MRGIRIKDIDFENGTVEVILKNHDEPTKVHVTKKALKILQTYIDFVYSKNKTTLSDREYRELYVFSFDDGKAPITSKTIQRIFQKAVEKVTTISEDEKYIFSEDGKKVKKHVYGPHSARHSFAINLLEKKVDIFTISKLLNHASITSTERYLLLFDEHLKEAVEKNPILDETQFDDFE